jgi:hypothetical protein
MRTDRRTDMSKLIVAFRNFANVPRIGFQNHGTDNADLFIIQFNTDPYLHNTLEWYKFIEKHRPHLFLKQNTTHFEIQ